MSNIVTIQARDIDYAARSVLRDARKKIQRRLDSGNFYSWTRTEEGIDVMNRLDEANLTLREARALQLEALKK